MSRMPIFNRRSFNYNTMRHRGSNMWAEEYLIIYHENASPGITDIIHCATEIRTQKKELETVLCTGRGG
jgi:hypothetical protein